MQIPPASVLMPVALHLFADKEIHSFDEIHTFLSGRCDIPEQDHDDRVVAKARRSFSGRVRKTWHGLERFGLTHLVREQSAQITEFGEHVAYDNPKQITPRYLEKFPEFRDSEYFAMREVRRRAAVKAATEGPKLSPTARQPPDEARLRNPRDVVVWFGTNRKPVNIDNVEQRFTTARDTQINFGRVTVNIPEGHRIGRKRLAVLWRWLKGTPGLVLRNIERLPELDFWCQLQEEFKANLEDNSMLLFLHGFWQTFEQAAIKTAQLKYDLKIPHAAFYSWPSHGSLSRYTADATNAAASAPYLGKFLRCLGELAGESRVRLHVVAHSMGSHALLIALEKILSSLKGGKPAFILTDIVFAAADVDQDIFVNSVSATMAFSQRRTLYASRKDRALKRSGNKHKMPRAGFLPPVTIEGHTDTIEVSQFDFNDLGHGYYASARPVLHDMFDLMHYGMPVASRQGIQPQRDKAGAYWRLM
jgi:esterase/lipase superfamily enzyme